MYTFYYHPGACSIASHIALEECGADYEAKHINLAKGEQRDPAYLAVNPRGKVPALVTDDGQVIVETPALLPFIADRFPEANLLPADPVARAHCLGIASWFASTVHIAYSHFSRPERYIGPAFDDAALAQARAFGRQLLWDCMAEIDAMMAGKTWLMGEQYTVVDPYALLFYGWAFAKDLPVREFANYTAHKDRLLARPAVQRVLAVEQSPLLAEAA